jgi:hypothetical protein
LLLLLSPAPAPKTSAPVATDTIPAADFYGRLVSTYPKRWAGKAFGPPSASGARDAGLFYALLFSVAQYGFSYLMTIWSYVRLQTRLATATDTNLDIASTDFFGSRLPRLSGELDPVFSKRLRAKIVAPSGCYVAIRGAISEYFTQNPDASLSGFDIFDQQSDPKRAAYYGLGNAQLAVIFIIRLRQRTRGFLAVQRSASARSWRTRVRFPSRLSARTLALRSSSTTQKIGATSPFMSRAAASQSSCKRIKEHPCPI